MRVKVSLVIILAISMNGMAQKTEDIIVTHQSQDTL